MGKAYSPDENACIGMAAVPEERYAGNVGGAA